MQINIIEGDLMVSKQIATIEGHATAELAILAAYDIISRIFGQEAVIRAHYNVDPDTMDEINKRHFG